MENLNVLLFVESRYKVNRRKIKTAIANILGKNGMKSNVEVSIAVVGDRKMRALNKKYRNLDKTTNVLSFPLAEGEDSRIPKDGFVRLGDIVLSYPQVIRDAARDDMLVDDKIDELIQHSLMHLLGIHHE